ncbi:MAG: hypothetical protein ABJA62_05635 [Luteimonas sp.]
MRDDPEYLPFKLDLANRRILMLRLSAQQRAQAAFLDERALPQAPQAVWAPLSMLDAASAAGATTSDFIFHIGHCGSTLLSRLLQSWPSCQVLREPLPLRTLAAALDSGELSYSDSVALLDRLIALWSRPFAGSTRTVIKATSGCNGLIAPTLACTEAAHGRVLLLDMPLQPYLSTLFKAEASINDALAAEPGRRLDLARRLGTPLPAHEAQTVPERCALGWLAERMRFHALATGPQGERALRVNFERLLAHPQNTLSEIAAHLSLPQAGVQIASASPAWSRYSKDDSYAYDAADRQHDLALADRRFAHEIEAGRRWLDRFVQRHPQCAAALA